MNEQISEEFARELLGDTCPSGFCSKLSFIKDALNTWKQKGYIKKSREEEVRTYLKEYLNDDPCLASVVIEKQKELIKILDDKIKGLSNEKN